MSPKMQITEDDIKDAIEALHSVGIAPTYRSIRVALGNRGSFATIQTLLAKISSDPDTVDKLLSEIEELKKKLAEERTARLHMERRLREGRA